MQTHSRRAPEPGGGTGSGHQGLPSTPGDLQPEVYAELRSIAQAYFRGSAGAQTLQPTALVHEAFIKIALAGRRDVTSRVHFVALAATAMRQILIDHARARATSKRGAEWNRVTSSDLETPTGQPRVMDLLALDEALRELAALDPRKARIVELRFFGGMNVKEIALRLQVSKTTVDSDWRVARSWLNARLREEI